MTSLPTSKYHKPIPMSIPSICRMIKKCSITIDVRLCGSKNTFGVAKMNFRLNRSSDSRELPFSIIDFLYMRFLATPFLYYYLTFHN